VVVTAVLAAPLALSVIALLDAARRPQWTWAMAERNQVGWMTAILLGTLLMCAGIAISGWYLWKIRPIIARAEMGILPPRSGPPHRRGGQERGGQERGGGPD
jgi:hypothetical protein